MGTPDVPIHLGTPIGQGQGNRSGNYRVRGPAGHIQVFFSPLRMPQLNAFAVPNVETPTAIAESQL